MEIKFPRIYGRGYVPSISATTQKFRHNGSNTNLNISCANAVAIRRLPLYISSPRGQADLQYWYLAYDRHVQSCIWLAIAASGMRNELTATCSPRFGNLVQDSHLLRYQNYIQSVIFSFLLLLNRLKWFAGGIYSIHHAVEEGTDFSQTPLHVTLTAIGPGPNNSFEHIQRGSPYMAKGHACRLKIQVPQIDLHESKSAERGGKRKDQGWKSYFCYVVGCIWLLSRYGP